MSRIGWDYASEPDPDGEDSGLQGRIFFFQLIVITILSILLYRVFWLQQTLGDNFTIQADENRFATLTIDPPRPPAALAVGEEV